MKTWHKSCTAPNPLWNSRHAVLKGRRPFNPGFQSIAIRGLHSVSIVIHDSGQSAQLPTWKATPIDFTGASHEYLKLSFCPGRSFALKHKLSLLGAHYCGINEYARCRDTNFQGPWALSWCTGLPLRRGRTHAEAHTSVSSPPTDICISLISVRLK